MADSRAVLRLKNLFDMQMCCALLCVVLRPKARLLVVSDVQPGALLGGHLEGVLDWPLVVTGAACSCRW